MTTETLPKPQRPIRVMIVDDSAIIRSLIDGILKTDSNIKVCGFANNGQKAIDLMPAYKPDVMILDIEMPIMDGITALPLLLEKNPDVKVIICSTLSDRGATISLKALDLGATECLLKPTSPSDIKENGGFHSGLIRLVRNIGASIVRESGQLPQSKTIKTAPPKPIKTLNTTSAMNPRILAIGSSTGGPNALGKLMPSLKGLNVPIVITQHMPATFTKILAEHLTKSCRINVFEAENGMPIEKGNAYIAKGGRHMLFEKTPNGVVIKLDDGALENFCKPAVDPMLRSLKKIYGGGILAVILTGMGDDGLKGAREVVSAGGQLIAQDEASSVVWGMPGAVANDGICNSILPLSQIADKIKLILGRL